MKTKRIRFLRVVAMCVFFLSVPNPVFAIDNQNGNSPWLLPDSSSTFRIIDVGLALDATPDWLQQFSEGIMIETPEKICYPFRLGQYNWVPQILQLENEKWIPIETDLQFIGGTEALPYACAETRTAGTFALFSYYHGPYEPIVASSPVTESPETEPEEPEPIICEPGYTLVGDHCQPIPHK